MNSLSLPLEKKSASEETLLNAEQAGEEAATQFLETAVLAAEAEGLEASDVASPTPELSTGSAEAPPPETTLLVQKNCSKCQQRFALDDLYKKSVNRYLCGNCNKLSTYLCRLDLPENFRQLNSQQLCEFYNNVSKMTTPDGKLSLQKVSTQVNLALETSVQSSTSSSLGSDYLPLSVWAFQGWDPKLVERAGIKKEDPKLGTVYKMEILKETVSETQSIKRKEGTTVNLRAKKTKRSRTTGDEPTVELVSSDEEDNKSNEDKQAKKLRKLQEKQQLKTFQKDTATASKAVSVLSPLLLQVSDAGKKAKAEALLLEAKEFLASAALDKTLSFEPAHVVTEANLLRAEAKPTAAPKKRGKGKAKAKAQPGFD